MNNPNPLIPQGSLLEQQAKSKPHLRIALFIVAVHVVFLGLLLMQGCKRETDDPNLADSSTNDFLTELPPQPLFPTNSLAELDLPSEQDTVVTEDFNQGNLGRLGDLPATMPATNNGTVPPPSRAFTPPPEILPAPESQLVTRQHEVVAGDTFFGIAKNYGVTSAAIAAANPNVDPLRLRPGQKLIIPPPAAAAPAPTPALAPGVELYEVRSGDTLTRIARARGTTAAAIRELNGKTTDRIYIGEKLKLPARTNTATTPSNP
jgi:LysM repeat protein